MNKYYVKTNYYNGKRNDFFMLKKETPCMLELIKVFSKQVSGDCFEGHEIPTNEKFIEFRKGKYGYVIIRVSKKNKEFSEWDGNPVPFDHL